MKKALLSLIIGLSMALSVVGCGTNTTDNKTETSAEKENSENTESVSTLSTNAKDEESAALEKVESKSEEPEQKEIMSEREEKYSELLDFMDAEDYDSATKYIEKLVKEKQKAEAGDIEDYLVEVEITKDNFFDYFDIEIMPHQNEWGDVEEGIYDLNLVNLKAEDGLILYDFEGDGIVFEIQYSENGYPDSVLGFISYARSNICTMGTDISEGYSIGRFVDGKVRFVKEDYIESYKVSNNLSIITPCTMTLKNGEVIEKELCYGQKF